MYQQTLDLTVGEDERVWFKVSGTHSIFLTGNYVEPAHSHDDEDEYDEDEYDLSPDEDELDYEVDSDDELDDLEDPRVTEVDSEEEAPALVAADKKSKKGKNKRAAEDTDEDVSQTLDDLISKADGGEQKLSKKQQKKLKNNAGQAVAAAEAPSSAKSDKKVQFAEKLEQGPTPSPSQAKTGGTRTVQGVTIDEKKAGTGPAAKSGNKVSMRYIGKLKDGKVFDSNKKGKPFSFTLGKGEVIKGWDIGIAGMAAGAERRITVPPSMAYGSKRLPDIPANSTLVFDVKCLDVGK